jgi:hypothetical protein
MNTSKTTTYSGIRGTSFSTTTEAGRSYVWRIKSNVVNKVGLTTEGSFSCYSAPDSTSSLTANPTTIVSGSNSTLTVSATGVNACEIETEDGDYEKGIDSNDEHNIVNYQTDVSNLTDTTKYVLSCDSSHGGNSPSLKYATVTVVPACSNGTSNPLENPPCTACSAPKAWVGRECIDPDDVSCAPWVTVGSKSQLATFAKIGELITWKTNPLYSVAWSGDVTGSPVGSSYSVRYSTVGNKTVFANGKKCTIGTGPESRTSLLIVSDPGFRDF